jgi:hypothetical protein
MDFSINDLLTIGLVGTALAFLIQWIKAKFGTTSLATKGLTILLALIIGGVFYFFKETAFFANVMGVLSMATLVWAFLIKGDSTTV